MTTKYIRSVRARKLALTGIAASLLVVLSTLAGPSASAASETSTEQPVITDGGFETTDWSSHHNEAWDTNGANARMTSDHIRTGAFGALLTNESSGEPTPSIQQTIVIPESKLAVLTYWHRFNQLGGTELTLRVVIDGVEVGSSSTVGFTAWTRTDVDVTNFADGNSHLLSFEFSFSDYYSAFVVIDDVATLMGQSAQVQMAYKPRRSLSSGTVVTHSLCRADRAVLVKRVRRGPDPTIDRGVTDKAGGFAIRWPAEPGRYYAAVPVSKRPQAACLSDTSPRLVVR